MAYSVFFIIAVFTEAFSVNGKYRIITEAVVSALFKENASVALTDSAKSSSVRERADYGTFKTRSSFFLRYIFKIFEKFLYISFVILLFAGIACAVNSRLAAEGINAKSAVITYCRFTACPADCPGIRP